MLTRKGHKAEVKDSSCVQINQAETINQYYNKKEVEVPKYLTGHPPRNNFFIGREDKIKEVENQLAQDNAVAIMNGWGGIGKTVLATEYYYRNIENYHHLIWLRMIDSLPETLVNKILVRNLGLEKSLTTELYDRAMEVSNSLTNLKGSHLLVLDNANNIEDVHKHTDLLPQINWKILLTTRGKIEGYFHINIDVLKLEDAQQLFYRYYQSEKNEAVLNQLLQMIGRHTLTIELMAKIGKNGKLKINEITKVLEKEGISSENLEFNLNTDYDKEHNKLKGILTAAFNYSAILEKEHQAKIFKHFILLPSIPVSVKDFSEWTGIESDVKTKNALNELVTMGWIKEELLIKEDVQLGDERYFVHPLVAETARSTIGIKESEVSDFTKNITKKISIDNYINPLDASEWLDFGRVLADYYKDSEDSTISVLQNNLALIYQSLGELIPAKKLMVKALESDRKNFGEDHPTTAIRYSNLAMIYKILGELKSGRELMKEALASDEKNFGKDHPTTAIRYSNLATIYVDLGELKIASELMEQALESDKKNFGEDHPSTARSYSNLAMIYQDLGEMQPARVLMEKALDSARKNFGEDHPSTAIRYSNLAQIYQALGKLKPARELMEKALESDWKNFGEDHPSTARSYSNLAMIYRDLEELKPARELMEKALESDRKNFGEEHPSTAIRYSNLAMIYQALGELQPARELMEKALGSDKKNFGEDHPSTARNSSNLALIYQDLGELQPARELMEKAYTIAKNVWGSEHPKTLAIKSNLIQLVRSIKFFKS